MAFSNQLELQATRLLQQYLPRVYSGERSSGGQRSTVSGRTINRWRREAGQRRSSQTQRTRSRRLSRGVGLGTQGNLELVTKDEILEGEFAARSKPNEEALEAKGEEFEQPAG